jgi:glycosyltransferase involved in cell wall biosynthesis
MKPLATVIVCAHNPRKDYLRRVLDGLQQQTLTKESWELLVIDNASREPLAGRWDLAWHSNSRHIREDELGLTAARLRGIRESRGELLIFVDDDNVPANDYLSIALMVAESSPHIGAFGASVKGEFEIPPPEWIAPYLPGLAVCEVHQDYWANLPIWSQAVPFGAGLCVRRSVAEDYAQKIVASPKRKALGRSGNGMGACEDTDLAWCAIDLGMGTGRFCALKLTHLIPKIRITSDYIVRLHAGFAASTLILESLRGAVNPNRGRGLVELIRLVWRLICGSRIERNILLASRKARRNALEFLAGLR